jgi:hypothetical protein
VPFIFWISSNLQLFSQLVSCGFDGEAFANFGASDPRRLPSTCNGLAPHKTSSVISFGLGRLSFPGFGHERAYANRWITPYKQDAVQGQIATGD